MVLSLKAWKSRSPPGLPRTERKILFTFFKQKPRGYAAGLFVFVLRLQCQDSTVGQSDGNGIVETAPSPAQGVFVRHGVAGVWIGREGPLIQRKRGDFFQRLQISEEAGGAGDSDGPPV